MAGFEAAYAATMRIEGGYANNPADKGGETYKGISRKNFPQWEGWKIVDLAKRTAPNSIDKVLAADKDLQLLVRKFYKANFWDVNRLDEVTNQVIAEELFDTGVNMGTGKAARFLQESLNLLNRNQKNYKDIAVDGIVGPQTLTLTNNHPDKVALYKMLNLMQGERYLDIMRNAPDQETFAYGWLDRVNFVKAL